MLAQGLKLNRPLATAASDNRLVVAHRWNTIEVLLIDTGGHLRIVARHFSVDETCLTAHLIIPFL